MKGPPDVQTIQQLRKIAVAESGHGDDIRLQAISLIPVVSRNLSPAEFEFVCSQLDIDQPVSSRSIAIDILKSTSLSPAQLRQLAGQLPRVGTMEMRPLIDLFAGSDDSTVGNAVLNSLLDSPSATALPPERVTELFAGFGPQLAARAVPLVERIEAENRDKIARLQSILSLLPNADIRRGLRVFQSPAAACIACHQRGYLGGNVGPDLDGIGKVRSERDLLESILFPSLTFVRNYEPAAVLTVDGQIYNGIVRQSGDAGITLQLDATRSVQIPRAEIERQQFSEVSIMPAGLEKQLTPQQLADLVKYLKEE